MIDCRLCVHWIDENLDDIPTPESGESSTHIFFGCKIYGHVEDYQTRATTCAEYEQSAELYALCASCQIVVPKVCLSMGACVNCLNTDLFCLENCIGEELRKYCTHHVKLSQQGLRIIRDNSVVDLFPPKKQDRGKAGAAQPEGGEGNAKETSQEK